MNNYADIASHFAFQGSVASIEALGNGLINDTLKLTTAEDSAPDYVLQRINTSVFGNVGLLQSNIEAVTRHIRRKLEAKGTTDIDRKVLHFLPSDNGTTYYFDGKDYWRMMVFIRESKTFEAVNPEHSYKAGLAFGEFEAMLCDIPDEIGETIPHFHDMELRLSQLDEAVKNDAVGCLAGVSDIVKELLFDADEMTKAERLFRYGQLPKRICHCDTKVNNVLFDYDGNVLCVIDLDTVMPSFVFSDFGDFLRTAANTGKEDEADLSLIDFDMEIFAAFTRGYIESARQFLTPLETDMLPWAAQLFPYMQSVRFLTDYINGDTYYKI